MKYIAAVLGTSLLAACGGGGGGGSGASPVAVAPTPTAVLSSANQSVAAQDTASSSFLPLTAAQTVTGAQTADESALFAFARGQMEKLQVYATDSKSGSTLVGVTQSNSVACTYGGSLTVSANVASTNGTVAAGDSLTITSNGCTESFGTINGSLGFVITSLNGTYASSSYSAGLTMTFNNFAVSSSQVTASINGSLSYGLSVTGANARTASVSTPSLTVSATYGGVARSRTLTNYVATLARTADPTSVYVTTYNVNGFLTSSSLSSQAIAFNTTTPIVTRYTDSYPSSGVLVITGASNSKIRITALSNTLVREELDANGDGTFESSTTAAWNTLM